jgi:O-antigen ligase
MSTTSLGWRFHNWTVLLPQWESHPWFGIGLGNTVTGGVGLGELPHSEYVRYLVETGVIGVALLICAVVYLIRRLRRLPPGEPHAAGTLGLAVLVGLLVNALTSNTLLYTPAAYAAILLIFAALGEGSGRHTPDLVEVHGLDVPSVTGR